MSTREDASIVSMDKLPAPRIIGAYTFLRDMGKTLTKGKAIEIRADDAAEAKKIQNRWRAYFKGEAHTRKAAQPDGKVILYLWKGE